MQSLNDFVSKAHIGFTATPANSNPNTAPSDWDLGASAWRCVLRRSGRRMTVPFSMGSAHTDPPALDDVLNSLVLDSSGFENAENFTSWCAEYGYDTDSRKAERIYKVVGRQRASLKRLLGDELYGDLLWNTESL